MANVLTSELLLKAYCAGVFPMAETACDSEIFWVDPPERGIIPLEGFHAPARLNRTIRNGAYSLTTDAAFEAVIDGCAARAETWINGDIRSAFVTLHSQGYAHSVEVWHEGELAGGLYGLAMGSAFFGESMFSRRRDASKIALAGLIHHMRQQGYVLLDTQFTTPHLERFGAVTIPREEYLRRLARALRIAAFWGGAGCLGL